MFLFLSFFIIQSTLKLFCTLALSCKCLFVFLLLLLIYISGLDVIGELDGYIFKRNLKINIIVPSVLEVEHS